MTAPSSDSELDEILNQVRSAGYDYASSFMTSQRSDEITAAAKAALLAWNKQRVEAAREDAIVLACPKPNCMVAMVSSRELSRWNGTGEITDPPHATSVWIPCEKHYQEGAEQFHCDKDGNEIPIDPRLWGDELTTRAESQGDE